MKNKQSLVLFRCSITLVVVSGLVLVIQYLHDRGIGYPTGGLSELDAISYYEISSANILSDLNLGKTSVFTPTDLSDLIATPYPPDSFPWHQSDYLMVANALRQMESKESNNWEIYGMIFDRECQNRPVGFDSAEITYFKYDSQQSNYRIHQIDISPRLEIVSFMEKGGFRRPLFGWKSINLSLLFVSADAALQKAEEYGGKQFRSILNNACAISLVTKPSTGGNNWLVSYRAHDSIENFRFRIDLYTGWYWVED